MEHQQIAILIFNIVDERIGLAWSCFSIESLLSLLVHVISDVVSELGQGGIVVALGLDDMNILWEVGREV